MKGALIHGVLLAVMLVYGYRTWTRDKTVEPNRGNVTIWDRVETDLTAIELKGDKKIVRLEHRSDGGDYWWGLDTAIEKKPKTPPAPDNKGSGSAAGSGSAGSAATGSGSAGSGSAVAKGSGSAGSGSAGSGSAVATGSGSAGSGSAVAAGSGSATGSGSAGSAKPVVEEEETRKTREFPLGENADKVIKSWAKALAMRDLGTITDESKKEYKLVDSKLTLTVTFKDGAHTFLVGGSTNSDVRYIMDEQTNKGYAVAKDMISGLEMGESNLHLVDPRGFDVAKIDAVTIDANGKSKTAVRVTQAAGEGQQEGKTVKTWGDPATKKPDQTLANFIDNANNLKPTEYVSTLKISELTPVLKLTYKEERGALLGTLTLYRREKIGELGPDQELDPANPPKGETEYYVVTEKSRVPGVVRKDTASRSEQDLEAVFSDHPTTDEPKKSIDPKGNPFGPKPPGNPPIHQRPHPPGGSGAGSAPAAGSAH